MPVYGVFVWRSDGGTGWITGPASGHRFISNMRSEALRFADREEAGQFARDLGHELVEGFSSRDETASVLEI